ncbi:MAG: signal peptidase I [Deltaproteobacteria bacterium]|nr:signal peptidase I [Deltaproteobacteria bacterium]
MSVTKRRSAVLAVLLSIPLPGLGQLYCGRLLAATLFALVYLSGWAAFGLAFAGLGWTLGAAGWLAFAVFGLAIVAAGLHAALAARRAGEAYALAPYNLWYFYLLVWLVVGLGSSAGALSWIRAALVSTEVVVDDGMVPGLLPGDRIRLDRRTGTLAAVGVGDVVGALDPVDGRTLRLLRVVAVGPGEVEMDAEGLKVGGERLARRVLPGSEYRRLGADGQWTTEPCRLVEEQLGGRWVRLCAQPGAGTRRSGRWDVPAGALWLLGDNRARAVDSAGFGPLPRGALLGAAFEVRYSFDPERRSLRPERKGLPIR